MRKLFATILFVLFTSTSSMAGPIVLYDNTNQPVGTADNPLSVSFSGDQSITGNLTIDGNLYADTISSTGTGPSSFTGGLVTIGTATPTYLDSGIGDLMVADDLEVDGNLYVDTIGNSVLVKNTNTTTTGISVQSVGNGDYPAYVNLYGGGGYSDGKRNGAIQFKGYESDGGGPTTQAVIEGVNDGNSTSTYVPGSLVFKTANTSTTLTERMRITRTGNVGVGTSTPTSDLDIGGGTATYIDGTDDALVKDDLEVDGEIYTTTMNIVGTGNTGIGTTTPSARLDVGGFTVTNVLATNSSGFKGDIEVDGKIYVDGGIYGSGLFGSAITGYLCWNGVGKFAFISDAACP